jgi:hypothetical protein
MVREVIAAIENLLDPPPLPRTVSQQVNA